MIAAIGAFDGFHRGHRTLLDRASLLAAEQNKRWSVLTFSRHPDNVLGGSDFRFLFPPREQELLQEYFDIPSVNRIPFTRALAGMLPAEFLDFIEKRFGVSGVVVGRDFRFGKNRGGTPEVLASECARRGWSLDIMPLVEYKGETLSSSRIRSAVMRGDPQEAREMLGYPFFCRGIVVHGDKRGRELGFPTVNLEVSDDKVRPAMGVYAGLVFCDGSWRAGAVNIGRNPTFGGERPPRLEAYLIDYEGDLYGKTLTVFILARIRGEKRFGDADSLRLRMAEDVAVSKEAAAAELAAHREMWARFANLGSCSSSSYML